MTTPTDTIVALATPPGRGGVGIVRVSGPLASTIAHGMLDCVPPPRRAEYLPFCDADGSVIDTGIALFFPSPHSFTGEDILELQGHGGPVVLDLLIKRAIALGARLARTGEFSERAFLNDKLDLVQAEAIADLIESGTEQAARAATRSLQGEFSAHINSLIEQLIELRIYVESAIDFPEEEIDFLSTGNVGVRLKGIIANLWGVLGSAHQGRLLREGMTVVIAGRPNAGKSSLLNRLACRDAAIVTDIPGTTRDVLREHINIDGLPLHIIDTAGLRDSADPVEQQGIQRAWGEIARADRVLLMVDDGAALDDGQGDELRNIVEKLPAGLPITVVHNKIDTTAREPGVREGNLGPEVALSVKTGAGIEALRQHLKESMGYSSAGEGGFMARRRHVDALQRAHQCLKNADHQFECHRAGELLAEDLRQAQQILSEITGEFTSDDLLGRIFASFCIGK